MNVFHRHMVVATLALGALLVNSTGALAQKYTPTVGLQSWTCRNMTFDQVVNFAVKHRLKHLQLIGNHIDPKGPLEEIKRKKAVLDQHGLVCYTIGVSGTSNSKEDNRKLFEFAKLMGCKMIIVEPRDMAQWDNLEELVKEYDVKLAIHNHGKGTVYGDPATVKQVLAARDARIGVCLDVGWVTAAKFDAAKVFREYEGRVFDIHLKDKKFEDVGGKEVLKDVEIGTGQTDYKSLLTELKKIKWKGVMAIETDNKDFAADPAHFVDSAVKFVKENAP